jgi:hypothetical protein
MKLGTWSVGALAAALFLVAPTQETPKPMVACYSSLADSILSLKRTEADFVRSMLDGHYQLAARRMESGEYALAAAEMSLFANEGDNAIGGVRKRLLEGGHHHNADGEAKGVYEPGFVIVTREAKQKALEDATALRQAKGEEQRQMAWKDFEALAERLVQRR